MIKIYKINTVVYLDQSLKGTIKQVLIEGENISYKIGYWDGKTYKTDWFSEVEFTTREIKTSIGFVSE